MNDSDVYVMSDVILPKLVARTVPAGVKSRGNKENIPATLASMKVRKYACLSAASRLKMITFVNISCGKRKCMAYLRGTRTSKTAFSCTCQPNKKDVYPQSVNTVRNDLYVGFNQSLMRRSYTDGVRTLNVCSMMSGELTDCIDTVIMKVCMGLMFGRMA
jgi:hypothetical protein